MYNNVFSRSLVQKSSQIFGQIRFFKTSSIQFSANTVCPSNFQKKILVWTKFYPNVNQVPSEVSFTQMKKAHDIFRVKSTIILVGIAFASIGLSMLSGTYLRDSGDSMSQRGLDQIEAWKKK